VAHAGQEIANPVTGERIRFVRTAADTGGELLEIEDTWPVGRRPPPHVHPEMEERWEVVTGVARVRIEGAEHELGPGDAVAAPAGAAHVAWNPGPERAVVTISFRPALRWEEFLERLFALAEEGRTDERGTPEPEALRELMTEFRREIAPARSD